MALTELRIRGLKTPEKVTRISDGEGLYLLTKPNGSKLWRYDCRFSGKRLTLAFGAWPKVSVTSARQLRDEARARLDQGLDPRGDTQEKHRPQKTFGALAEQWFAMWESEWSDTHRVKVRRILDNDLLPSLGHLGIADIEPPALLTVIRTIEARGVRETAHAARGYAGRIFRLGVAEGVCARDPSADIRDALKPRPKTRNQKRLSEADLPAFFTALADGRLDEKTHDALLLTILTASRTGEIRFAVKDEFFDLDGDEPTWRIPVDRMKMDREHIVPLSRQAAAVVKRRIKAARSDFLFEADTRSQVISENTMLYALYRLGYHSRATVHGFRGTFSTIANEHGWNRDWIEMALAHVQGGVRSAYNAAQYIRQRREMLQWWADYLVEMDSALR